MRSVAIWWEELGRILQMCAMNQKGVYSFCEDIKQKDSIFVLIGFSRALLAVEIE
jgi:hypothetical protein